MIISYDTHDKIEPLDDDLMIIETSSRFVYLDILNGLNDRNDLIKIFDNEYNKLEKSKYIDFYGDLISFNGLSTKQINSVVKKIVGYFDNDDIDYMQRNISSLINFIQEKLFFLDIPLLITQDIDIEKSIKKLNIHLNPDIEGNPYDILELLIRLKMETQDKSLIVVNNLANYLNNDQLQSIEKLCKEFKVPLLDIEFCKNKDINNTDFSFCKYYFIDDDFVDWHS
ncbi:type II-A CRISPR-associated protein Csn2 [Apilactobacillus kunkeei]|uniref:type II-A CRISPR-associated protein Csn2 n=1 Tax=Apilactobacillus kunkeei TaxID=148814 RepID=UPI00200A4E9C|nr:type II-A CRISPR-associated protein Csn2 [Apilactobacillus kunkeei]MCK8620415.1 type II-A CRISPR-associated protein Csn2 [Apilactobacillus kunkeei]